MSLSRDETRILIIYAAGYMDVGYDGDTYLITAADPKCVRFIELSEDELEDLVALLNSET